MTALGAIVAQTEIVRLRTLLAAREGKPGYKSNRNAIRAEIARLEAQHPPATT